MLDTAGPEIRTGLLKNKTVELKINQKLKITTDYDFEGDDTCISCSYEDLCTTVQKGQQILIADGNLTCIVDEVKEDHLITTC